MSPLKWHAEGYRRWGAWSTQDGQFTPFAFLIEMYELPLSCLLEVRDPKHALPILRVKFDHRQWTDDMVKTFAETIRPTLPQFVGQQQEDPTEAITAALRSRWRLPTQCGYVHAFPIGATESTVCLGGHVTKGYVESAPSLQGSVAGRSPADEEIDLRRSPRDRDSGSRELRPTTATKGSTRHEG